MQVVHNLNEMSKIWQANVIIHHHHSLTIVITLMITFKKKTFCECEKAIDVLPRAKLINNKEYLLKSDVTN